MVKTVFTIKYMRNICLNQLMTTRSTLWLTDAILGDIVMDDNSYSSNFSSHIKPISRINIKRKHLVQPRANRTWHNGSQRTAQTNNLILRSFSKRNIIDGPANTAIFTADQCSTCAILSHTSSNQIISWFMVTSITSYWRRYLNKKHPLLIGYLCNNLISLSCDTGTTTLTMRHDICLSEMSSK